MTTARRKKKENIVEYLLYMWQVEDMIRACGLDMNVIETKIISQYSQSEEVMTETCQWYSDLCNMMRSEGVTERGHIQIIKNDMAELVELHLSLLKNPQETLYGSLYYKALPAIVQLRSKSGGVEQSEIETCITAVYGYLLLKMQSREISAETDESIRTISAMLAFLAAK
ncbi:MAG: DUF4924 family protein, partial [Tannerella sp.]|nr:DUF4924 family protein [Tannerella sp.]